MPRQIIHALELAREDIDRWCSDLTDAELSTRPFDLPSVAFQLRHIARSLDRLLTYAEARQLTPEQMSALGDELHGSACTSGVLDELRSGLEDATRRILSIEIGSYEQGRGVGRKQLPTTVAGLLIHCAEHTQRHVGQAVTTAKLILSMRGGEGGA